MSNIHAFFLLCLFAILSVQVSSALSSSSSGCSSEDPQDSTSIQGAPDMSQQLKSGLDSVESITIEVIEQVFGNWEQNCKTRQDLIQKIVLKGKVINLKSRKTDLIVNRNFKTDPLIYNMEQMQLPFEDATEQLCRMFNLSRDTITYKLPYVNVKDKLGTRNLQACKQAIATTLCDPTSKYRTIDGRCNNLKNSNWGSARSCQPRLLPANYVGTSGYRRSKDGKPLPRGRVLSLNLHYHSNWPSYEWSHMYMYFGQLLDHDIAHTPQSTTTDNQGIECCPADDENHPQCAPIPIPKNDPYYSQYNITCMNFVRSAVCPTCTFGCRQVMNQATSFIDASMVYGNTDNETQSLRANDGTGRLRTYRNDKGVFLPHSADPESDGCSYPSTNDICFQSGDSRCNQHTVLASLQTICLREHNKIARKLKRINPQWDEEKLFQETRRIIGAIIQVITYKEFLPITLGRKGMTKYNLWLGGRTLYNCDEDPTTLVEFTTAAFRFGHSLVNDIVAYHPLNATNEPRYLRNGFGEPFEISKGLLGPIVAGACHSPSQQFDRHLVPDLRNYLYRTRGSATGLDLAAINIYRGRDHGLPTYIEAVRYCSQDEIQIKSFKDLEEKNLMQSDQVRLLRWNYGFVDDIDLWSGILSEIQCEGAAVGPTGVCIIGLQFYKLKYGDRFYFEHTEEVGSFTEQQITALQNVTLSQILCKNTKIRRLPRNAMLSTSINNADVECKDFRDIDLSSWKE